MTGLPATSIALALALASSAGGHPQSPDRISPEEASRRVQACGFGPVVIRYDDLLQSHVLAISATTSPSDEQLTCIDRAAAYHDVALPPAVQPRFDAIRQARQSAAALAEARAWLAARGLLERVPAFHTGTTDETDFARQLELLCGRAARGALRSSYGPLALSPEWLRALPQTRKGEEALNCLLSAAQVAGFAIGFIGNEADTGDE